MEINTIYNAISEWTKCLFVLFAGLVISIPHSVANELQDSLVAQGISTMPSSKLWVTPRLITAEQQEKADHTFALVINGGHSPSQNSYKYWNDCAFMYQILRNKFGVPKDNIYVAMSDGTDPGADMQSETGGRISQPLDLDFDGVADIQYAATTLTIGQIIQSVKTRIRENDHLFIFVTDHGDFDGGNSSSFMCLWNETLYPATLLEWLEPISEKNANISLVMGCCHSGGFVNPLSAINCVVATSCKADEMSIEGSSTDFSEFLHNWMSAINGKSPNGTVCDADTNDDGHVTMREAFNYALGHKTISATPQYGSFPASIGDDLAFTRLPNSWDLYLKDSEEDTGIEPNDVTPTFWSSPSIWIREKNDGGTIHQNPGISSDDDEAAYVYVRVYNRGKAAFNGRNQWVALYWADATTATDQTVWKGQIKRNGKPIGGYLGSIEIPAIEAGADTTLVLRWPYGEALPPYPSRENHYCIFAKIMDQEDDDGYEPGKKYFNARAYNDQAQRNVTIFSNRYVENEMTLWVGNLTETFKNFDISIQPVTPSDRPFFRDNRIEVTFGPSLAPALSGAGSDIEGFAVLTPGVVGESPNMVRLNSDEGIVRNIQIAPNTRDSIRVKFTYLPKTDVGGKIDENPYHSFNVIQKDAAGNVIGGEMILVSSVAPSTGSVLKSADKQEDGGVQLSGRTDNYDSFLWLDSESEVIGRDSQVTLAPLTTKTTVKVIGVTDEGEMATETVELDPNDGIKSATADGNTLTVELRSAATIDSQIEIVAVTDGSVKLSELLEDGCLTATADVSSLDTGIYTIVYRRNGKVVDSVKINI